MNIKNAQYHVSPTGQRTIVCTMDGKSTVVFLNGYIYEDMLLQVEAGELTVAEAKE